MVGGGFVNWGGGGGGGFGKLGVGEGGCGKKTIKGSVKLR